MRSWFRRAKGAVILLYHRVAELDADPWSLAVTPERFAEHLEVLKEDFAPRGLAAVVDESRRRRRVAVTFDDGYADTFENAWPLLERAAIPATWFLPSGELGRSRGFWWDELEHLLLRPETLPPALRLDLDGTRHEWELGGAACYPREEQARHRAWRGWEGPPGRRQEVFADLWRRLRPLADATRRDALDELRDQTGIVPRPSGRCLSADELRELAAHDLVEIGAHTATHPRLSELAAAAQEDEIRRSRRDLEDTLGRRVASFAYPFGDHGDYTPETVVRVREAGFERACASFSGVVGRSTSLFELPRVGVGDVGGDELARELLRWLDG